MQKNVYLPALEAGFESTVVLQWLVEVGDAVRAEQSVLEIETQKAVSEVPSNEAGYVHRLCVEPNQTIVANTLICILTDTLEEPFSQEVAPDIAATGRTGAQAQAHAAPVGDAGAGIKALPAVRKLARELGIDLAIVRGSGAQGQITLDDIKAASRVAGDSNMEGF